MQADNEPPGQPDGDGDGLGDGDGEGPPLVVEPSGPTLISEKMTCELAADDSISDGTPELPLQVPRESKAFVESAGNVLSSQSMLT